MSNSPFGYFLIFSCLVLIISHIIISKTRLKTSYTFLEYKWKTRIYKFTLLFLILSITIFLTAKLISANSDEKTYFGPIFDFYSEFQTNSRKKASDTPAINSKSSNWLISSFRTNIEQNTVSLTLITFFTSLMLTLWKSGAKLKLAKVFGRAGNFLLLWALLMVVIQTVLIKTSVDTIRYININYRLTAESNELTLGALYFHGTELLILLVFLTSYYLWIKGVQFSQLVEEDGIWPSNAKKNLEPFKFFTLKPKLRIFFPKMSSSFKLPVQCMIIGPKGHGKTRLAEVCSPDYELENNTKKGNSKTGKDKQATSAEATASLEIASFNGKDNKHFWAIDAPGENLGDHIALPFQMRTDLLVLVIDAHSLKVDENGVINFGYRFKSSNSEYINMRSTKIFEDQHAQRIKLATNYFRKSKSQPNGVPKSKADEIGEKLAQNAVEYFKALAYSMNRDTNGVDGVPGLVRYKAPARWSIGSFVLVLNHHNTETTDHPFTTIDLDNNRKKQFENLSQDIGHLFGVKLSRCKFFEKSLHTPINGQDSVFENSYDFLRDDCILNQQNYANIGQTNQPNHIPE